MRSLACIGLFATVCIALCAQIGNLVSSANVRAFERRDTPTIDSIFAVAHILIEALHLSLTAAEYSVLPPLDSLTFSGLPKNNTNSLQSGCVAQKVERRAGGR